MYRRFFNRIFDFVVAFITLIILSPIFLVIAIVLFIANNGRPFFAQARPGRNERLIKILKFRTMDNTKDAKGNLLPDEQRLTRIGKWIRSTSLDELPQLINIIKGEMSLVGPRPLLISYLPYYTEEERKRHTIRPGITGLAQISGRNRLSWDERLAKDVEYVNNCSFLLDLSILMKSVQKVLRSEDIVILPGTEMQNLDEERKISADLGN